MKILRNVHIFSRQGLALRGSGGDNISSFMQLLKLRGDYDKSDQLDGKRTNRFHSPEVQIELVELMALWVLHKVLKPIQHSQFLTVMMDNLQSCTCTCTFI